MSETPLTILLASREQLTTQEFLRRCFPLGHSVQWLDFSMQSEQSFEQSRHCVVLGSPNWPFLQLVTQELILPVLFKNLPFSHTVQFSGDPSHSLQLGLHWPQLPSTELLKYPDEHLDKQSRDLSGPLQTTPASSVWSQFSRPQPICWQAINDVSFPKERNNLKTSGVVSTQSYCRLTRTVYIHLLLQPSSLLF